jgi:hypothetical protein
MFAPEDIPPAPDRDDLATVRAFTFTLKTACDEFHDDPFTPVACAPSWCTSSSTKNQPPTPRRSAHKRRCAASPFVSALR